MNKKFTIMLVPLSHEKVLKFNISSLTIYIVALVSVILIAMATVFIALGTNPFQVNSIRFKNTKYRSTLEQFNDSMNENEKNFIKTKKRVIQFIKSYYPAFEKRYKISKNLTASEELNFLISKLDQFSKLKKNMNRFFVSIPSIFPVVGGGKVNSPFGTRRDPFTGTFAFHTGVDIFKLPNVPIRSSASGIVRLAQYNPSYGFMVIIDHKYGFATLYAHMINMPIVKDGEKIRQGQIIGYVGSTGRSVGYHLHYEVRNSKNYLNPRHYLFLKNGFE